MAKWVLIGIGVMHLIWAILYVLEKDVIKSEIHSQSALMCAIGAILLANIEKLKK